MQNDHLPAELPLYAANFKEPKRNPLWLRGARKRNMLNVNLEDIKMGHNPIQILELKQIHTQ